MKSHLSLPVVFVFFAAIASVFADNRPFIIASGERVCSIYVDPNAAEVCRIAAADLAEDIERIGGRKPRLVSGSERPSGPCILIGTFNTGGLIDRLADAGLIDAFDVRGKWETFAVQVVNHPLPEVERALVIAGSDRRGTAFGVYDLSQRLGVSPWTWWADVPVVARDLVTVDGGRRREGPPSIKYRGIFLNDEDWGLHPWAKETFAPEDGYIGPKTYERVFELLLRLKANLLWPAMHECTKAFFEFEGNRRLAADYAIMIGSSHCEPMLRNNVWEWERWSPPDGRRGEWDWCTNSDQVVEYWRQRVEECAGVDCIYTIGMRGVHDGRMPCRGASSRQKTEKMQTEVFPAQRHLIAELIHPDPAQVPQIFCPYKEVLDMYNMGLEAPADVTLVWPDDNHGYIRRLSTPAEQARAGSAGVYYHISYYGTPHDYLWLCSTPPGLIWEEMRKAYDYGADRLWVLNVGDLKPAEMDTEFFLQMGWNIERWDASNLDAFMEAWAGRQFPKRFAPEIADILTEYYRLGFARKPEHMGFNTVMPYTDVQEPLFSPVYGGDETQRRIDAYRGIAERAERIYGQLEDAWKDAFFELVLYPVCGAARMNEKYLYAQKSRFYASQGRTVANFLARRAREAHDEILRLTERYNTEIAGGKWKGMMSHNPRRLKVFDPPVVAETKPAATAEMGVCAEGQTADAPTQSLPVFDVYTQREHFIDLFNKGAEPFDWTAEISEPWVELSQTAGSVLDQERLRVGLDWRRAPLGEHRASIRFRGTGRTVIVALKAVNPAEPRPEAMEGFVQSNGVISIEAEHYTRKTDGRDAAWAALPALGRTGGSMMIWPNTAPSRHEPQDVLRNSPCLEYACWFWEAGTYRVRLIFIPTHSIHPQRGLRCGVSFDAQLPLAVEYDTAEWSDPWKVNVLRGAAVAEAELALADAGPHTLKLRMMDPGVVIDKIVIYKDSLPPSYLGPPETAVKKPL